ncbi:MAG: rhodanese-like domain-containing protein [Oxalobacter sp.]|uniref:rhodanese-like domain-containing protein n=1 Tax=Oxalobacter paeniformigenes TaxID=2946594 RepID=UPI0022AF18B3|nr:rhodanese-like domain-containing protein [Oxalobacter paeniformigenes]MBS7404553.1 rhodanese-like domain-containing protein [Oxalobacter sp.]MCZ4052933.1 rhodanese-like domain-containing protein [Oxalobacter paeniformigenes]
MNFIRDNIFLICVALYCIGALVWPYIRKGAKITNSQATKIINKGKTAIIDIRDQKQYQAGHILNAVHVPLTSLQERIQKLEKFKGQPIIIVDESGKESDKAASILKKEGFSQINILKGGMTGWVGEGLPVTK